MQITRNSFRTKICTALIVALRSTAGKEGEGSGDVVGVSEDVHANSQVILFRKSLAHISLLLSLKVITTTSIS